MDENKKFKKINEEHQDLEEKVKENVANLKVIGKQNEEIKSIKRKSEADRDTIVRLKEEKSRLVSDN
jgi:uncharacterized protein YdcH (DUF465 family)